MGATTLKIKSSRTNQFQENQNLSQHAPKTGFGLSQQIKLSQNTLKQGISTIKKAEKVWMQFQDLFYPLYVVSSTPQEPYEKWSKEKKRFMNSRIANAVLDGAIHLKKQYQGLFETYVKTSEFMREYKFEDALKNIQSMIDQLRYLKEVLNISQIEDDLLWEEYEAETETETETDYLETSTQEMEEIEKKDKQIYIEKMQWLNSKKIVSSFKQEKQQKSARSEFYVPVYKKYELKMQPLKVFQTNFEKNIEIKSNQLIKEVLKRLMEFEKARHEDLTTRDDTSPQNQRLQSQQSQFM